jgi:hypothetical protein
VLNLRHRWCRFLHRRTRLLDELQSLLHHVVFTAAPPPLPRKDWRTSMLLLVWLFFALSLFLPSALFHLLVLLMFFLCRYLGFSWTPENHHSLGLCDSLHPHSLPTTSGHYHLSSLSLCRTTRKIKKRTSNGICHSFLWLSHASSFCLSAFIPFHSFAYIHPLLLKFTALSFRIHSIDRGFTALSMYSEFQPSHLYLSIQDLPQCILFPPRFRFLFFSLCIGRSFVHTPVSDVASYGFRFDSISAFVHSTPSFICFKIPPIHLKCLAFFYVYMYDQKCEIAKTFFIAR